MSPTDNNRKKIASGQITLKTSDDTSAPAPANKPPVKSLPSNPPVNPVKPAPNPVIRPAAPPAPINNNPSNNMFGGGYDWGAPMNNGWGNTGGSSAGKPMTMDEKVDVIKKIYQEVLGREAETKDINYHKYGIVDEDSMRRKLVQTNEHKDLLQKGREYQKIKELYDSTDAKNKMYESKIKDHMEEFKKLHEMLEEKNRYIQEMRAPGGETAVAPTMQVQSTVQPAIQPIENESLVKGLIDFIKSLFNF